MVKRSQNQKEEGLKIVRRTQIKSRMMHQKMIRKTHKLAVLAIIAITFIMAGCSDRPYFDKFYSFDNNEWPQHVKPVFNIEVDDTTKWYDFVLTLRTTTDYGNSNLWVFLNTKTPSGIKAREPFQIRIADEKGAWLGQKSGTTVEHQLIFRKRKFPEIGVYEFILEQGITEERIEEILNVGLTMTAYEKGD